MGELVGPAPLQTILPAKDLTGTGGLASGARVLAFPSPKSSDSHPKPGRRQPKRPFPPARGPPNHRPAVRRKSTGCKTALKILFFA